MTRIGSFRRADCETIAVLVHSGHQPSCDIIDLGRNGNRGGDAISLPADNAKREMESDDENHIPGRQSKRNRFTLLFGSMRQKDHD